VFVADWYDSEINYQRTLKNMSRFDRQRGCIYRVFAAGTKRPGRFGLSQLASGELVELISHENNWYAAEARRLLAERRDRSVIERLKELVAADEDPLALKALRPLYVSGGFDDELAIDLLGHKNEDVRAWTVRLLGDECEVSDEVAARILQLARDESGAIVRS
jgi:hypothetical protein